MAKISGDFIEYFRFYFVSKAYSYWGCNRNYDIFLWSFEFSNKSHRVIQIREIVLDRSRATKHTKRKYKSTFGTAFSKPLSSIELAFVIPEYNEAMIGRTCGSLLRWYHSLWNFLGLLFLLKLIDCLPMWANRIIRIQARVRFYW